MPVDSFKYLPRIIAAFYQMPSTMLRQPEHSIPWTPLPRPVADCKFGLATSGGPYHQGVELPFDLEREKQESTWGDPTYRILPADIQQAEVGASHLHINTRDVLEDFNILLPIHRFQELAADGGKPRYGDGGKPRERVGGLAKHAYSFMGYQGFPSDTTAWQQTYGPQVAERLKAEEVDCVLKRKAAHPCLTGLRRQRARVGTDARGCRPFHHPGDEHALLGRKSRRAAHPGRRVALRPYAGPAPRCGPA